MSLESIFSIPEKPIYCECKEGLNNEFLNIYSQILIKFMIE